MRLTLLSLLFLFSQLAFSQDAVEVVYDGISDSGSRAKARQEIFKEAIEKTSEKYIIDIVGEEKFSKNKAIIKSNIIKNSGKYILFIKAQKIDSSGPGTKVSVQLKLSLDSLRQLLLREGLFYLAEGPPQVLPLVTFQDKVNSRSFSWWSAAPESDNAMNIQQAQQLSRELKKSLRGHGFFGLQPVRHSFFKMIPSVYQSTNPRTDDYLFLGEFFRSPIIVKGSVKTDKDREQPGQFVVSVKLEALQSVNGRIIGEISRRYETEQGPFASVVGKKFEEVLEKASSDLVVQIHDAWKRGTFGSSLI